jgi:hypothetical protein
MQILEMGAFSAGWSILPPSWRRHWTYRAFRSALWAVRSAEEWPPARGVRNRHPRVT